MIERRPGPLSPGSVPNLIQEVDHIKDVELPALCSELAVQPGDRRLKDRKRGLLKRMVDINRMLNQHANHAR